MPEIIDYMKVIASLAIVIVSIYAIYYYLNNFVVKVNKKDGKIKILETCPLGKQRFLILAKIQETLLLLSSDETGIKILKEWEKEDS